MIEFVHLQNFKCLRDVAFEGLQPLTVVVGPSGVGKTSLLQALWWMGNVESANSERYGSNPFSFKGMTEHPGLGRLVTRGAASVSLVSRGPSFEARLEASAEGSVTAEHTGTRPAVSLLEFDLRRLTEASVAESRPHMRPDGSGLPTLLAYFAGAERDTLDAIETELRAIVGITGRVRTFPDEREVEERESIQIDGQLVPRVSRRKTVVHRFEVDIDGLGSIPADLLSEGTLVTLGILVVLHQTRGPQLILIDDIDKGLHPDAQAKLVAALRKLIASRGDLQVICTSHSPYLLDHFEPREVQVMSLDRGGIAVARLDQHEDWPRWQGKLQTGEFWQSVGESWVSTRPEPPLDRAPVEASADGE